MLFASTHNRQSRNRNSTQTAQSVWRTNKTGWFKTYYNIFRIITFLTSLPLSSLSPVFFTLHSDNTMSVPSRGSVLFYDGKVYLFYIWYITPRTRDVTIARHPSTQVTQQTLNQSSINVLARILTYGRNVQTLKNRVNSLQDQILCNQMQPSVKLLNWYICGSAFYLNTGLKVS
jgi:hypothetical protein